MDNNVTKSSDSLPVDLDSMLMSSCDNFPHDSVTMWRFRITASCVNRLSRNASQPSAVYR
jgi:hypothetical protein